MQNSILLLTAKENNLHGLLTKREVKMVGYWPKSLFWKRGGQYLAKQASGQ